MKRRKMENENRYHFIIGVDSWIIQDGNYADFSVGDQQTFALEFHQDDVKIVPSNAKSCTHLRDSQYVVTAEVVFLSKRVWVLDFGILAFQESQPPRGLKIGDFIETEIHLGIDSFSYFERLFNIKGMLPLIYTWEISEVLIETAPILEKIHPTGQREFFRDETKRGTKPIRATNAWVDDQGRAEYFLICKKLNYAPAFKL
jgi:hypothetical protein